MGQKIKSLLLQQQHFEHSDKPARQQTRRRHAAKAAGRKPGGGAAPPTAGATRPPAKQPPEASPGFTRFLGCLLYKSYCTRECYWVKTGRHCDDILSSREQTPHPQMHDKQF